jgi:hypothetical protein
VCMCMCLSFCLRTSTHACVDSNPSIAFSRYSPLASGAGILLCVSPLLSYNSPSFDNKQRTRRTKQKQNGGSNLHNNPVARLAAACVRVCAEQSTQRRRRRWSNAATRSAPAESCTRTRPGPVSGRGGAGSRGAPVGLGRLRGYVDHHDHVDDDG